MVRGFPFELVDAHRGGPRQLIAVEVVDLFPHDLGDQKLLGTVGQLIGRKDRLGPGHVLDDQLREPV